MDIKEVAAKYGDYLIEMRRYFHTHPELSGKEFNTSKRVKEELDKIGVEWRDCGMETGVLATIKGAKPGKTILIRGDMDALPIAEETGLPFTSENQGVMHACGHDCHISMMLTAAHILNDVKSELCGTVKLAFQPAEETGEGAAAMIANGALDGVDGCFGMHVWSTVHAGKVSCEAGPRMAATDKFVIDVKGKGGHGSAPHQCVDAAVVCSAIVNNLQTVISREIDPVDPGVITVGTINVGDRWNVIAETGHMEGTTRCFSTKIWDALPEALERIVTGTAKTMRAEATVQNIRVVPPTINDASVAAVAQTAIGEIFGDGAMEPLDRITGGEDFAFYMQKCPGAIAMLGVGSEACDAVWPQHSSHYKVDESALLNGAALYAQVAMDFNKQ
jgi:amidohydrolase